MTQPPVDDELARLERDIPILQVRAEQARQHWAAADAILTAALKRRDFLLWQRAQARATQPLVSAPAQAVPPAGPAMPPAPAMPSPPAPFPAAPAPAAPEASTRTVQNILFVLGGLLLGVAAIVFTAVAWATFGLVGRAAILGVVTLLALAAPLVALWRKLRASAETFAAIGLLLVVLDGFAVWAVNLFGVNDGPGTRYTAVVCLITAAIAAAYRRTTPLAGPAFVGLVMAQPVLPLFAIAAKPSIAGWSASFAAVAVLNLLLVWRQKGASPYHTAMRVLEWLAFGMALIIALGLAVSALIEPATVGQATWAALALLLCAAVFALSALVVRDESYTALVGTAVVLSVAAATGRVLTVAWPERELVLASLAGAAAAAVAGLLASRLPTSIRAGLRAGALVTASILAVVLGLLTLVSAGTSMVDAQPAWNADLARTPVYTWQLVDSLILLGLALLVLLPRRIDTLLATGTALALALPASLAIPWWSAPTVDTFAVAVLATAAVLTTRTPSIWLRSALAAGMGLHAVLTSLARPASTAIVVGAIGVLGLTLAVASGRRTGHRRLIGGAGALVGLTAVPAAIGAALVADDRLEPWWIARLTVASLIVVLAGLLAVRAWLRPLFWYAFAAVLIGAAIWPVVGALSGRDPVGVYGGVALLVIATALLPARLDQTTTVDSAGTGPVAAPPSTARVLGLLGAGFAALPGAILLASDAVPATLSVVALPYAWFSAIWSGVPAGVGLAPVGSFVDKPFVSVAAAVALALLAVSAATTAYALSRRWSSIVTGLGIGGPTAILVALAAAGAAWPSVPAANLVLGGAITLAATVRRLPVWRTVVAVTQGVVYLGAGLAGALTVEWATIVALAYLTIVATVIAAVGRSVPWRAIGAVLAVAAAFATATTSGVAGDLRLRNAAFLALAVAMVALTAGAALRSRRPVESTAIEAAAHAGALVAVLFTIGYSGHAAIACALWGVAVGLRALWPHTSRAGRAALAALAAAWELVAWWLLLADNSITLVEAYTLPLAAVGLLAGWAALRARPELRSWVAYGPALAAAFLPSLAGVLVPDALIWRRLLLGLGALVVVILGATRRRQAPLVVGSLVLAIVAVHEIALVWQLLPIWLPIAVIGALIVALAITYERRLRDLARIRAAVGRMR